MAAWWEGRGEKYILILARDYLPGKMVHFLQCEIPFAARSNLYFEAIAAQVDLLAFAPDMCLESLQ